jgi:CheY-like chemotaxis protein
MGKRILLADDSVTIQKVVELTFMDEDYEVVAVSNGDDAVARLGEVEPDIVIADVHMPGASGYEVCERVKQWRPRTPVLLLVGTFEPFQEAEAQRVGADSYLKKPFDSQELLHRTQELTAAAEQEVDPVVLGTPADEMDLWQASAPDAAATEGGMLYPDAVGGEEPAGPLGQQVPDEMVLEASPWTEAEEGGEAASPSPVAAPEPAAATAPASRPQPAATPSSGPSYATTLAEVSPAATVLAPTAAPAPASPPAAAGAPAPAASTNGGLSDADVDRIARRVVELMGDRLVREVAWEVVPDMAELVIKDRLRELERQLEGP